MWAVDAVMGGLDLDAELEKTEHHLSTAQQGEKNKEQREIKRAFVVGRPPGHHAGPSGCVPPPNFFRVPGMTSSGFCLLNTVAVAAAYARYRYGRQALLYNPPTPKPRIAIVDIDIHHGNGTEAIVRNLTPHMQALPLPSSWAPQWRASYKPWLDESDAEDTFFGSVHLYAGDSFYPCTGCDEVSIFDSTKAATPGAGAGAGTGTGTANVVNVALTPIGPGPWDPKTRAKLSASQLRQLTDAASAEMRTKVSSMLLPALHAFKPSLLLISAGFDAHHDDLYHFLTEADYHWMTGKVKANTQALDVKLLYAHTCTLFCFFILPLAETVILPFCIITHSHSFSFSSSIPFPPMLRFDRFPEQLVSVTEQHGGRVVSVLEGGYSLSAPVTEKRPVRSRPKAHSKEGLGLGLAGEELGGALVSAGSSSASQSADMGSMFAQQPGDGGLVKGVLAHVCALSGRSSWC